jgi:mono/diheme cytochrome c family protein
MSQTPTRQSGTRGWGLYVTGVAVGIVVIALLVVAFAVGYNLGETRAREAADEREPAPETAPTGTDGAAEATAVLFGDTCGSCHTLQAAGATGTVGPDLDALQPSREQVLAAIANGGTGSGVMPSGLLSGNDAEQVAAYVAASAGSRR